MEFIKDDFLLHSDSAKKLYFEYAKDMPIIDYHCHIDAKDIAEDKKFDTITSVWLGGDHYKWRQMRACGIEEKYITGDATDYEKFTKWAEVLPRLVGNPLYHWSHLELKNYFGYNGVLTPKTAPEVWELCNNQLKTMSAKEIILSSNVETICTTDDPSDSLEWHKQIADSSFPVKVLPAWRPDKILNVETASFLEYINTLSEASGIKISDWTSLKTAIQNRLQYFKSLGCVLSDHSLPYVMYHPASEEEVNQILLSALNGVSLASEQILKYQTMCLLFMAEEYHSLGWAMQLHYGVMRNNNTKMFDAIGPDTGFDCIGDTAPLSQLSQFLNALSSNDTLPKTIIYSLNPNDNTSIDTVIGCFQDETCVGKLQHGAAWWFNDNKEGIINHLTSLSNIGTIGNFIGMLTDSRSFLSYTRHDYFRRILCEYFGSLMEKGEYPKDYDTLGNIVKDICYNNAKSYFNF